MEMLNNVNMFLASDLWQTLIGLFANWIVNYGWAIILFTVCLKVVLSPLDIFQRKSSAKQQTVMTAIQPELTVLQQKYANNKEKLNQETAKLYKKHNVSMGGMCLSVLITMVLTMVIFFTLFSSLRSYGSEKLYSTYTDLRKSYDEAVTYVNANPATYNTEELKIEYIEEQVLIEYKKQSERNSWLWVKNVWKSDTNDDQFVEYKAYEKKFFKDKKGEAKEGIILADEQKKYDDIVAIIEAENPGQNGYYVLIVGAAVISFLTQFLSAKLLTPKGQKMNMMNKIMFAVIPLTMVILALNSNVVFTLYTIVNSIMTAILSTIISIVTKRKNKGQPEEVLLKKGNVEVVEYSRNYKK